MDRNGDGRGQSVIQLDMDPDRGCQCALFRLHFGAGLNGFAFHLGDSATHDGYGGDAGTDPIHYAEAHIKIDPSGPLLAVHSASGEVLGPDPLLKMPLPDLGGHFMDVEVCHETLEFRLDGDPGGVGSSESMLVSRLRRPPSTGTSHSLRRPASATVRARARPSGDQVVSPPGAPRSRTSAPLWLSTSFRPAPAASTSMPPSGENLAHFWSPSISGARGRAGPAGCPAAADP